MSEGADWEVLRRVALRAEELGKIPHGSARRYFREQRTAYEAVGEPYGANFAGLLRWLDEDKQRL